NDALAITEAATNSGLAPSVAAQKAAAVTLQLDRAPLDGWIGDKGWANVTALLTANVSGLGVSQALIDQTVADMKAIAVAAGVTPAEYQKFSSDFSALQQGQNSIVSASPTSTQPGLIYAQHLSGFFHGVVNQRAFDSAKLNGDLANDEAAAGATPAQ